MGLARCVALGSFILFGMPVFSYATHIQATVAAVGAGGAPIQNNDSTDCSPDGLLCSLTLSNANGSAKTYGPIKIEAYYTSAGPAKVEVGPDGSGDRISLKNAKITIVPGSVLPIDYQITFWSTFTDPPTRQGGTETISYELVGTSIGTLKRGLQGASGDIVKARGFLGYPVQSDGTVVAGNWKQLTSPTGNPELIHNIVVGAYNFFPTSNGTIAELFPRAGGAPLSGLRILKTEFQFKLINLNDILMIPHTTPLILRNAGATED